MCHAWEFGHTYHSLLKKHNWNGIVMCSNDDTFSRSLAFESENLGWAERLYWEFSILPSDWSNGRALYTTALTSGLLQLRQDELMSKREVNISLADFNEHFLKPICKSLSSTFGLPAQNPTLFYHVPN